MSLQGTLSIQKLMIFRRFQVDAKEIKCLLEWWKKHESMFPIVGFFLETNIRDYRVPN